MTNKPTTQRPRPITIQSQATTATTFGAQPGAWTDLLASWALEWRPATGKEQLMAQQINAQATDAIVIRFPPSTPILPVHRVKLVAPGRTRYFAINAVLDDQQRDQLILLCTEAAV